MTRNWALIGIKEEVPLQPVSTSLQPMWQVLIDTSLLGIKWKQRPMMREKAWKQWRRKKLTRASLKQENPWTLRCSILKISLRILWLISQAEIVVITSNTHHVIHHLLNSTHKSSSSKQVIPIKGSKRCMEVELSLETETLKDYQTLHSVLAHEPHMLAHQIHSGSV